MGKEVGRNGKQTLLLKKKLNFTFEVQAINNRCF